MSGYIYFVQPLEFIHTNVYKIGKTINPNNRFKAYFPKLTIRDPRYNILKIYTVLNMNHVESIVKREFSRKYCLQQGHEYFIIPKLNEAVWLFDDIVRSNRNYPAYEDIEYIPDSTSEYDSEYDEDYILDEDYEDDGFVILDENQYSDDEYVPHN